MKYLLECGMCGTINERSYLPQKFRCKECGECVETDGYEMKVNKNE